MIKMSADDKKKILLAVIVAAIVVYADYAVLFNFQANAIKGADSKIRKLQKDIADLEKNMALMQHAQSKPEKARKIKKIMPEDQIGLVLDEIENIARKNNVRITQVEPVREPKEEKAGFSEEAKAPRVEKDATCKLIPIDLSCGYHEFGKFLNGLEDMGFVVSVAEMKVMSNPGDTLRQNVNLLLKAYVKK